MVFSSAVFLFGFLPLVLAGYFLLPKKFRNGFLTVASLLFYAWGEPKFVFVMILSILMNYVYGLLVVRREDSGYQKVIITLMVVSNLSLFFVFKYLNFTIENLNVLFRGAIPQTHIVLPIGISFFTFQAMSYVFDVALGRGEVQKNPLNVMMYVALFPQLIAGPIVRYETVANEIQGRKESLEDFSRGIRRFSVGLAKKMILSNSVALLADQAFGISDASQLSCALAWIGVLAYAFQIYFDFSGYSDMAIGLGLMFGFHFEENFNYPYISRTVSEFWQRWHISLSTWFRDYLFYPVSRKAVPLGKKVKKRWGKVAGRQLGIHSLGCLLRHPSDCRTYFPAYLEKAGEAAEHQHRKTLVCGISDAQDHVPGAAGLCVVPLRYHDQGGELFQRHVWSGRKCAGGRRGGGCPSQPRFGAASVRGCFHTCGWVCSEKTGTAG